MIDNNLKFVGVKTGNGIVCLKYSNNIPNYKNEDEIVSINIADNNDNHNYNHNYNSQITEKNILYNSFKPNGNKENKQNKDDIDIIQIDFEDKDN